MRKTARFLWEKGFTLVELLIVIALIGVLAVAVLAAINPLEQLNRARDTGMESDASQLLAAIDRYYATQEKFPWQTVDPTNYPTPDTPLLITSAQAQIVGVCAATCAGAGNDGILLGQYELKSEFRNRKFITTTSPMNELYLGKLLGASSSVYACWVPTSKAKRVKATHDTGSIPTAADTCDPAAATWGDLATSCFICIPQ